MAEKSVIVNDMKMKYEGLFDAKEIYKLIENWLKDNGYSKKEALNQETVRPHTRNIQIKLCPSKKLTDYAKSTLKLNLKMNDIKEVEIKKDGYKVKMNQGKLELGCQGILETDYEGRWEKKPAMMVIRAFFDKVIFKKYTDTYEDKIHQDLKELTTELKTYLNMQKKH